MTDPIIFISRNRVKEGMLGDFTKHYLESIPRTEADKLGTVVQLSYLDNNATECVVIRVFPDAEAMDNQLGGADERSKTTYQFIEPTSVEIYGAPSDFTLEMLKKVAGSGIGVSIYPQFIGGFIRPKPG